MPGRLPGGPEELESVIQPWLELPGVTTAALASTDGLLVAAAGSHGNEVEALVANCASVLDAAKGLYSESDQGRPQLIAVVADRHGIIMAPLGRELFLILAGDPGIVRLAGDHGFHGIHFRR